VAGALDQIEVAPVGRYADGADSVIREIARDLEKSGFRAPVEADIMYWKYAKLLNNLGNALEAVTGPIIEPAAREIYDAAKAEGSAVLAAAGIRYASAQEQADLLAEQSHLLRAENPLRIGGSSWQSLSRGAGSIEADYLNGEIVMLGRDHGIPTPVNRLLQREANLLAREGRPPGDVPVADLVRTLSAERSGALSLPAAACAGCRI
jgi:2-dehydropantoate 2-reductase